MPADGLAHEHACAELRAKVDMRDTDGGVPGQGDDRDQRRGGAQERLDRLERRPWLDVVGDQSQERPGQGLFFESVQSPELTI